MLFEGRNCVVGLLVDKRSRLLLITGADRGIRDQNGDVQIYNSLFALTDKSEIEATYDKTHLVPFGEYMPLRWLIPFKKLTEGVGDFSKGAGLTTLAVSGLPPFSPLICYEAIFPAWRACSTSAAVRARANVSG